MTYALIGSGNIAWLIASRMQSAGHACTGVWSRNIEAADELCKRFNLPRLASLPEFRDGPDVCIIAVADDAIADIAAALPLRHTTLIHTAGAVQIDVLSAHCAHAGVVWPVYSVRKAALPAHRNFAALVEATTDQAREHVHGVAKAICDTIHEADSEQRKWLHLAAVVGNNFVNHLLGVAADICAAHNVPLNLLQPLLEQTLMGTYTQHPAALQTGPARRHDLETISAHLELLAGHPGWQQLYSSLSQAIMDRFPLPGKG